MHSQLDHSVARRMRTELGDHFSDVRAAGGDTTTVVGQDLAGFADDWAASHDAPGPFAGWHWRIAAFALALFAFAMAHRTIDLVPDGEAEIGYVAAALLAIVLAIPIGLGLPWLTRLTTSGAPRAELRQIAVFTVAATAAVLALGGTVVLVLDRIDVSADPGPGRWWVALALGLLAGLGAMVAIDRQP